MKQIEEITNDDLLELWSAIGGTPHLFEYGKDDLKKTLITGETVDDSDEPNGLQLDYYTMAAIVDTLRKRGFQTNPVDNIVESEEKRDVPSDNNNEGASLASHSCTIGNSIEREQAAKDFVASLYWPEPTEGISESDIEVKHSLGQAKSLAENSFKAGWDVGNKKSNPITKEQGEKWMRIMMSLVRVGYNHAATEIFTYCIENKVTPQFQDFISSMLNEENKKQFSYEMFKDELKKMKDEPLPNSTLNAPVSDTTEADSSNADHQIKISQLREKFFKECTDDYHYSTRPHSKLAKVNKAPHDLFEWFKPYLKIFSIDWKGLEKDFTDAWSTRFDVESVEDSINWLKTKLQDYIK